MTDLERARAWIEGSHGDEAPLSEAIMSLAALLAEARAEGRRAGLDEAARAIDAYREQWHQSPELLTHHVLGEGAHRIRALAKEGKP